MFTIDQIFTNIFPWLEGISWDVGTLLTGLLFLSFLVLGFDYLKLMFFGRFEVQRFNKAADKYYDEAESAWNERDTFDQNSLEWEERNLTYKSLLKKSVDSRVRGRR